jgi:hypothetical protein
MAMRNIFRRNISWHHWTYAIKTGKLEYFYNPKGLRMKRNDWKYLLDSLLFVNISSIAMQKNTSSDYTGMIGAIFTFTCRCPC